MPMSADGARGIGDLLSSKTLFRGRVVRLDVDEVRFANGSVSNLEIVRHPGAAAVLAVLGGLDEADPEVVLVRQYRPAPGGFLLEIPAGLPRDRSEEWQDCARRELREETGYEAGQLDYLTHIYTSPGFTDEVVHLFVASRLTEGEVARDPDEVMEVVTVRFSRALEMVRAGTLVDGKSVAAILYLAAKGARGAPDGGGAPFRGLDLSTAEDMDSEGAR